MNKLQLKGIGPPYEKQLEIIDYILKPSKEVKQVDICCGRGFGKTVLAIIIAVLKLSESPHEVGLFLEPDWKRVHRVFLKKWKKIIPKELYILNKSENLITWINGSLLYYGPRNITGSLTSKEDNQLGQDTTFVIDDEAALGCSRQFYTNTLATIRLPSKSRFYLLLSTPRVGAFRTLVSSKGHKIFEGSSRDNPYLPDNYVDTLLLNMSADEAQREIEGKFVSLRGKIWKNWSDDPWPYGNIHCGHNSHDYNIPYWLFCDIGSATGAYAIVQYIKANQANVGQVFPGGLWICTADLCPKDDASASRAFQLIKREFGIPAAVVGGTDINTRSRGGGKTVYYFAQQVFGLNIRTIPVSEKTYDKQLQYDRLSYLVCNTANQRRFCIAKNFLALEPESRRGVREMMAEDEFPPENKRRNNEFLPKDQNNLVQHIRDALLMGAVAIMSPPEYDFNKYPAA